MKLPTFALLSIMWMDVRAFQTPKGMHTTGTSVRGGGKALLVARSPPDNEMRPNSNNNNDSKDSMPKDQNLLQKLDGVSNKMGEKTLDERTDLTKEHAKLLLQIINDLDGISSSKPQTYSSAPTMTARSMPASSMAQEMDGRPPSLVSLAFRLLTKELAAGQVDSEWVRLVSAVFALNIVAPLVNVNNSQIAAFNNLIRTSLAQALNADIQYATYGKHAEYPDQSLEGLMKMTKGVPPIEYWFSLKKTLRVVVRGLTTEISLSLNPLKESDTGSVENYNKLFKIGPFSNPFAPMPSVGAGRWTEDREFARQFLNGVNPIMVEVVKDVQDQLSPDLVALFEDDKTINLDALSKANRLFYVDYKDLVGLEKEPHQAYPKAYNNITTVTDPEILAMIGKEPRYFKAPIVLLQLSPNLKHLEVLGIQLDREVGSKVFTSLNSSKDEWQFAKTTVATADSQYHEWVTHLGMTHLTMEPHILAIHNTLKAKNHPVYKFVQPMCRDTLLLNFAARQTLTDFGAVSFGDYMTSVGVGQFMQLILKYWESYDFFKSSALDEELASRGFTDDIDIPCYRYRTDSLKIWKAYGTFAQNFVDEVYSSDQDVVKDRVLQKWAWETHHPTGAAIKGFPKQFDSKALLAKTLQTLFWICSGFHAAVNMPQYDYYAYQPNKPLGIRKSIEHFDEANGDMAWMFEEAMPYLDKAREAATTTRVLTLESNHCITNLDEYFTDVGTGAYAQFKKDLEIISDEIEKRSREDRGKGVPVYEYLKPSNIPASIDI